TFDLDGAAASGLATVQWLVDNGVPATVFITGEAAGGADGTAGPQGVSPHPPPFSIGKARLGLARPHSPHAAPPRHPPPPAHTALDTAPGRSTAPFLRPAAGLQDLAVRTTAGAGGWSYLVLWDVDPADRLAEIDGGPTVDDLTARVVARSRGGSIVLLHFDG